MKNSTAVMILLVIINIFGFFAPFQDHVLLIPSCMIACTYWIVKTIEDTKTV